MDIQTITSAITPAVEERGCFLVGVGLSADNDITLTVERETGTVSMDDCVALDRAFHQLFDQDVEDYSLTVTSAGLDQPFRVAAQYRKATGSAVEIQFKGGKKLIGTLLGADEAGVTVRYSARENVEGKKKKELVVHEETFPFETVNSVRPHIEFE